MHCVSARTKILLVFVYKKTLHFQRFSFVTVIQYFKDYLSYTKEYKIGLQIINLDFQIHSEFLMELGR